MDAITHYLENLPNKPYTTNEKGSLWIRSKKTALKNRYLQHNAPYRTSCLVFDVDRKTSAFDWEDTSIAEPNFVSTNPENGHSHLYYLLKHPVYASKIASKSAKPIYLLNLVKHCFNGRLKADYGYSGLVSKNPTHPSWQNRVVHNHLYELNELGEFVPEGMKLPPKREVVEAVGRNCDLFETARHYGYKLARQGLSGKELSDAILSYCSDLNDDFLEPMGFNEVKQIAWSIAKYSQSRFTPEEFSEIQSHRGKLSGEARLKKTALDRWRAKSLWADGYTQKEIAEWFSVHRNTIRNWLK